MREIVVRERRAALRCEFLAPVLCLHRNCLKPRPDSFHATPQISSPSFWALTAHRWPGEMLKYSTFEEEKAILESKISDLQAQLSRAKADLEHLLARNPAQDNEFSAIQNTLPMTLSEYRRYGRQMILEGIGLPGLYCNQSPSILLTCYGKKRTAEAEKRIRSRCGCGRSRLPCHPVLGRGWCR